MTIDELLSGEELITLAETENRSNLKKIYSFIYGILDMMAVTFILLPLYGNLVDGYIYSVNLLSFTNTTPIYLAIYWIVFIVLIALGIAMLAPGENRHFEPGENSQFQSGRNRQSVPGGCSQPRFGCRF